MSIKSFGQAVGVSCGICEADEAQVSSPFAGWALRRLCVDCAAASDPAFDAAMSHAEQSGCCGNEVWRGRLCEYHQGFEDGYTVARPHAL